MGTHLIPREIDGDGRILYIFTGKGFLFALIGMAIGAIIKCVPIHTPPSFKKSYYSPFNFIIKHIFFVGKSEKKSHCCDF